MADESGYIDADEGGYVDDELDVDDDIDADMSGAIDAPSGTWGSSMDNAAGRTSVAVDKSQRTDKKPGLIDPRDFTLRACGSKERSIILARFLTSCPDLSPPTRMRALRENEKTPAERKEAIRADRKQHAFYRSHIGKNRRENRQRQGYVDIPDRDRKSWIIDVYSPAEKSDDAGLGTNAAVGTGIADARKCSGDSVEKNELPVDAKASAGAEASVRVNKRVPGVYDAHCPHTRQYVGTMEGKSTSRYAVLIVDEETRSANVVPVGQHAWYSLRQKRGRRPSRQRTTEAAEQAMKRKEQYGRSKLAKFQEQKEEAEGKSELGLGSIAVIRAKGESAPIGIFRGSTKRDGVKVESGEGMDFDEVFDNDDVAQVDQEDEEKDGGKQVRGDKEAQAKKFRKMIKDEAEVSTSRPNSPTSDSDDDGEQNALDAMFKHRTSSPRDSDDGGSRPQSPSKNATPAASPSHNGSIGRLPPKLPKSRSQATGSRPRGGSLRQATPGSASPAPSSSPSTPLREEYAHLLPPAGTLPTAEHVVAVLRALLKSRKQKPLSLKEFTRAFPRDTKEQQQNLAVIVKEVAQLSELVPGSKTYYISLRPAYDQV